MFASDTIIRRKNDESWATTKRAWCFRVRIRQAPASAMKFDPMGPECFSNNNMQLQGWIEEVSVGRVSKPST